MFKNRLLNIMLIILVALTLIGVIAFVLYTQFFEEAEADTDIQPTIEEVVARSIETEEITTNLLTNQIIRSSFVLEGEHEDARSELEMRNFQVENIIIAELSDMSAEDFRGSEGIRTLENNIREQLNEIMQEGEVVQVYMNQKVIQ
ncbi:flagellar basal body-associated protein FliL [Alkalicoccus daliensis]|uniref:Flagellar protein FliL n=1 Tax=Alkalicoccus daliensis TaxID=745820 RepID=A0A1H0A4E5_9BACI|nr:flagellar basal body-associated protein FliL [Alkalicoccus daliensis]SDN28297.1 flagellar FliL protein [Alkalicoccus daliensis]